MKLNEAFRTGTFRATVVGSLFFAGAMLLLYGFLFWQTVGFERARIDEFLIDESQALLQESPSQQRHDVETRFANDLHRLTFAAIFSRDGTVEGGDISAFPPSLVVDGKVHSVVVMRPTTHGPVREGAWAVANRLPDGRLLIVGRSEENLAKLRALLTRGFIIGLAPGLALALLAGTLASLRMLARIATLNETIERIMAGAIDVRLPVHRTRDAVDRLAASVNRMLDRIGQLIHEVQGVGDDIAHDLRTPLARARSRLEGGRVRAITREDLAQVVDRAIADLDQTFATITALLRIRQIETSQRRTNFGDVNLVALLKEAQDLYQPVAELRGQTIELANQPAVRVVGDRDLLFEAVANLLDNAVKFTPDGGSIRLAAYPDSGAGAVLRVADSGPGIPRPERAAVLRRFYRADPARQAAGTGLGLSLVAAILRLHEFSLDIHEIDGMFAIDIVCRGGQS